MAGQEMLETSCALVRFLMRAAYRASATIEDLVEGQGRRDTS